MRKMGYQRMTISVSPIVGDLLRKIAKKEGVAYSELIEASVLNWALQSGFHKEVRDYAYRGE
jgi:hypothetical protein